VHFRIFAAPAQALLTPDEGGTMDSASIAILAGGKSSRFEGLDKQKAAFRGEALGRRIAVQALAIGCEVLVVGHEKELYADLPVVVVSDLRSGYGPLSGLHAALSKASSSWVYLLACDMPFFNPSWFSHLLGLAQTLDPDPSAPKAILAVKEDHIEPFHAMYSTSLAQELNDFLSLAEKEGDARRLSFHRFIKSRPWLKVPEDAALGVLGDWSIFSGANDRETLGKLEGVSPGLATGNMV
jgi:molybdopterin-guanine dinucleotide biosynthesis protein A